MKCGSIQTNHLTEKATRVILGNSLFSHKVPFSANIYMCGSLYKLLQCALAKNLFKGSLK